MRRQVLVLGTALLVCVAAASASMGTSGPHEKRPPQAARVQSYGALPLAFELNAGQANPTVKFVAKGRGYSILLTAAEAVVALQSASGHPKGRGKSLGASGQEVTSAPAPAGMTIRMAVVGANPGVEVMGAEQLPGKANYFVGNDSRKWRTGIPTYAKVRLDGIYRGIDLVYYGREGQLEYDFVISPGADAAAIALALLDAAGRPLKVHINAGGDLIVRAGAEQIRFAKPVMYQVDAKGTTTAVHGSFALKGEGNVGFNVSAYDQTRPLVIDPVLQYSTFYGGSELDSANAIAVDGAGNAYITGFTRSFDDFPTNTAVSPHYGGTADSQNRDAFVAKLNADGTHYVYSTYLGGTREDVGYGIAVDAAGNAYVTGNTHSDDFPLRMPTRMDSPA